MASCRLCNSFGRTKIQYNYDLATAHAKTHFLQMEIIDDGELDMDQIFGQCFPDFAPMNAPTGSARSAGRRKLLIKACIRGRKKAAQSNGVTVRKSSMSTIRSHTKRSHLAVERQLFCYRLIRKVVDQSGKVQCRLCSKGIRATNGENISCQKVKAHAYRHLLTPLYRCRLCSAEPYFGRRDLEFHLRGTHALPCLEQNYECLDDQYHSEILAIMDKCYGIKNESAEKEVAFRNLSETSICKKSTRSKLTVRRHLLCHRLIRKNGDGERRVQCRVCSKRISGKAAIGPVMQHALSHLGKKLYQCKECSSSFVRLHDVLRHLKKEHALPMSNEYVQSLCDQYHADIEGILRQCYGNEGNEEEGFTDAPMSVKSESSEITFCGPSKLTVERKALCLQLTQECSNPKDKKLLCRLCSKWICVKAGNGVGSACSMLHALVHLEKPIYRCKICSDTFNTGSTVGQHLRMHHALPMLNNYDCSEDQFHAEIMEMLRKCYNKEAATEAKPFKSRTRAEARVRMNVKGSKHAVERQLLCHRLIRKFVTADGKVECRVCNKRIATKTGEYYSSGNAMRHAMIHLKKPIYRCQICSERFPYLALITNHLKKVHGLPSLNSFECFTDEFHSEILAKLSECYGEL